MLRLHQVTDQPVQVEEFLHQRRARSSQTIITAPGEIHNKMNTPVLPGVPPITSGITVTTALPMVIHITGARIPIPRSAVRHEVIRTIAEGQREVAPPPVRVLMEEQEVAINSKSISVL